MSEEFWFKLTIAGSVDRSFVNEVRELQGIDIHEFLEKFFTELIHEHIEGGIRVGDVTLEGEWVGKEQQN